MSPDQCLEAQAAFRLIEGRSHSLLFYLRFALERFDDSVERITFSKALNDFVTSKSREQEQGAICEIHFVRMRRELLKFRDQCGIKLLDDLKPEHIENWLEIQSIGTKTWNNKRSYIDTFLNFCGRKDWMRANPCKKVSKRSNRRRGSSAVALDPDKAAELMAFVENDDGQGLKPRGFMVPYFALCLFAGIRADIATGEIGRLKPEHINQETGVIHVLPDVSKVGDRRTIVIQPNLQAWLGRYPLETFPIVPPNADRHRWRIRRRFQLPQNTLRHSFISYLVAKDRSIGDAALQAGNTEAIVRKHYLDLKSRNEAEAFWAIFPKSF